MRSKLLVVLAIVLTVGVVVTVLVRRESVTLKGVVLQQDADPKKQTPIPDVKITATYDGRSIEGSSGPSGFFQFKLNRSWRQHSVTMAFRHPDYQSVTTTVLLNNDLCVLHLPPVPPPPAQPGTMPETLVKSVRIRYTEQAFGVINVGSTVKTFLVPNTGNVPCGNHPPCSPDGRWKAAEGNVTINSGEEQQFTHVRVSCIAGPCPFTKVESGITVGPARIIQVRVLNWSDTVAFLVEAEVTRDTRTDAVRVAYPAIYGRTMSFTLPGTGQGPSIEADLGGKQIVFPLGPALLLSWANCASDVSADRTQLFRCELKPGYGFQ